MGFLHGDYPYFCIPFSRTHERVLLQMNEFRKFMGLKRMYFRIRIFILAKFDVYLHQLLQRLRNGTLTPRSTSVSSLFQPILSLTIANSESR